MPACPHCGAATAPGPACAACGRPLPAAVPGVAEATDALAPLRIVAGSLLAVGIFVAVSGLILLGAVAWFAVVSPMETVFPLAIVLAGAAGIVSGACLLARQSWAWGLAVGLVAFGLIYAVMGLARGYSSGFIGLAVWGALAYGLSRDDVRAPLRQ